MNVNAGREPDTTVDADELISDFPHVYHAAVAGSWHSLREYGLRTTYDLVASSDLPDASRVNQLTKRRAHSFTFEHPQLGRVTLRDHKPLQLHNLKLPQDFTLEQWLAILNERVFFWANPERLDGFLKVYKEREHIVLTVDTRSLVDAHGRRIRLSPINSGATARPNAPGRGPHTFAAIEDYRYGHYRKNNGRKDAIVELTVLGGVSDIARHVVKVERRRGDEILGEIEL
jgi:hypothetical protein